MKLIPVSEIRKVEAITIDKQNITSTDLMERASTAFSGWFKNKCGNTDRTVLVVCGQGKNGGDGLAIARQLSQSGYTVKIWIVRAGSKVDNDFLLMYEKLPVRQINEILQINEETPLPDIAPGTVIIDALFGTGLNRRVEGLPLRMIQYINQSGCEVFSVDIPSGMPADGLAGWPVVQSTHTLAFEFAHRAFYLKEHQEFIPDWEVVSIGLDPLAIQYAPTHCYTIDRTFVETLLKPRTRFSHKGTYGHAGIAAGSKGKYGAGILSATACLKAGAGLVTLHTTAEAAPAVHAHIPEIMVSASGDDYVHVFPQEASYDALAFGPGLGVHAATAQAFTEWITTAQKPVVLDADALNILALHKEKLAFLPKGSILTPHPGEFERLFGASVNSQVQQDLQVKLSSSLKVYIVLKQAYTTISTPEGELYYNTTGNPGMATAGSGDVLTGILTSLLAQGYTPLESCLAGVYIHGLAGDLAAREVGMPSLVASDIIRHLSKAFLDLNPEYSGL